MITQGEQENFMNVERHVIVDYQNYLVNVKGLEVSTEEVAREFINKHGQEFRSWYFKHYSERR